MASPSTLAQLGNTECVARGRRRSDPSEERHRPHRLAVHREHTARRAAVSLGPRDPVRERVRPGPPRDRAVRAGVDVRVPGPDRAGVCRMQSAWLQGHRRPGQKRSECCAEAATICRRPAYRRSFAPIRASLDGGFVETPSRLYQCPPATPFEAPVTLDRSIRDSRAPLVRLLLGGRPAYLCGSAGGSASLVADSSSRLSVGMPFHGGHQSSAPHVGAILASVFRADFALALRKAFQLPSARWWRRSVR